MLKNICALALVAGLAVSALHDSRTFAQGRAGYQGQPAGRGAGQAGTQAPAGGGPPAAPALDPTKPHKLDVSEGTKARYKVQEQLAGITFNSDAVGTTEAVTGTFVVNPDGSIDAARSKLTVDLRTLKSDQPNRDNFLQMRTLETAKFPTTEFVPKRAVGLPAPLPGSGPTANAGFQLIGDMTLHGVTKEVTWNVVSTFANDLVAGRATTTLLFSDFNITKPSLARILSVDDKIILEIEFRAKRSLL
jgi:polyisoprenoid-binding protein YceI